MTQPIDRGKQIIKDAIRSTETGEIARIPVADQENLVVFEQALRAADVQRMVIQKGVSVEFYFPEPPVEQAKKHMLTVIESADSEVREILFPYLQEDYADAEIAIASPEVQAALVTRGMTASLQRVGPQKPEIVIASYDQVINGELDRFLEEL
ncbi:hypothetical protein [Nostoc sp. UHCC 0252]|uniref:hypothetical protein n=1 Tax=Nostoc sp. UHCC 0252 TaxID=3110241 RepID=UPI002B2175D7|nr:hypothetical protein [Nostoc sp. UHCC 0252]MEA5601057.1 hypothetical protein [Nostoc sp. UHCC 0252]